MGMYIEDMCCQCEMGCRSCGRKHVAVYVCEKCGRETTIPEEDGWDMEEELCYECKEREEE